MVRRVLSALAVVVVALVAWVWNSENGQDWLLEKAATAVLGAPGPMEQFDGLKVFMCGTSSPLPDPKRAQACIAILAGESLFIVDSGAGSVKVLTLGRVPLQKLEAVFLTHFHSDHISALPDLNLNSWVAGRPVPLTVYGPTGVHDVVDGFNHTFQQDRSYRVAHHGADLLPPELGPMQARQVETGGVFEFGDLKVTSFVVNHEPVEPALGYRFDYRGRSVVISGDTTATPGLVEAATGADLLLQDALSATIIQTMEKTASGTRMEKILHDIQDYHAHTADLKGLADRTGVRLLALYHLVPPPGNALFEKIFERDLPDDAVITEDGMMFELPAGSEEIRRIDP